MKRDESLYITRSALIDILREIKYTSRMGCTKLADQIIDDAQPHQIRTRYLDLLRLKGKVRKKVTRSLESDTDVPVKNVEVFHGILMAERRKRNEFGKIRPIMKDHKDYVLLKEIAKNAYSFVDTFEITNKRDGMLEYIDIGLSLMRKYTLNRFKYYNDKIFSIFEDKVKVLQDSDRDGTKMLSVAYLLLLEETSGVEMRDIDKDYVKYANFVYAREQADECESDYTDWITAQFSGLAFMDVIPEVHQLYGDNAKKRYESYINQSGASAMKTEDDSVVSQYKDYKEENK